MGHVGARSKIFCLLCLSAPTPVHTHASLAVVAQAPTRRDVLVLVAEKVKQLGRLYFLDAAAPDVAGAGRPATPPMLFSPPPAPPCPTFFLLRSVLPHVALPPSPPRSGSCGRLAGHASSADSTAHTGLRTQEAPCSHKGERALIAPSARLALCLIPSLSLVPGQPQQHKREHQRHHTKAVEERSIHPEELPSRLVGAAVDAFLSCLFALHCPPPPCLPPPPSQGALRPSRRLRIRSFPSSTSSTASSISGRRWSAHADIHGQGRRMRCLLSAFSRGTCSPAARSSLLLRPRISASLVVCSLTLVFALPLVYTPHSFQLRDSAAWQPDWVLRTLREVGVPAVVLHDAVRRLLVASKVSPLRASHTLAPPHLGRRCVVFPCKLWRLSQARVSPCCVHGAPSPPFLFDSCLLCRPPSGRSQLRASTSCV